ncbi:hypothetical protein LU293_09015 [Moraxella nasovis]|uniref:hypothetical protein n=1 Tax=Moraxella nasovis TaxID=2904121 RepID=UPI001F62349D|nr:hypothetical protein [Moraxella nasovis]UNU73200.1 hypothetical protein LU293_09015 [Moraxella nasovis]
MDVTRYLPALIKHCLYRSLAASLFVVLLQLLSGCQAVSYHQSPLPIDGINSSVPPDNSKAAEQATKSAKKPSKSTPKLAKSTNKLIDRIFILESWF